ncbi:MAG: hypothetical protein ACTSV2_14130 [Candidatus Thorarchaeota archaeon]
MMNHFQNVLKTFQLLESYASFIYETISFIELRTSFTSGNELKHFLDDYSKMHTFYPDWFNGFIIKYQFGGNDISFDLRVTPDANGFSLDSHDLNRRISDIVPNSQVSDILEQILNSDGTVLEYDLLYSLIEFSSEDDSISSRQQWDVSLQLMKSVVENYLRLHFGLQESDKIKVLFYLFPDNLIRRINDLNIPSFGEDLLAGNTALLIAIHRFDGVITGKKLLATSLDNLRDNQDLVDNLKETCIQSESLTKVMTKITKYLNVEPIPPDIFRVERSIGIDGEKFESAFEILELLGYLELVATAVVLVDTKSILLTVSIEKTLSGYLSIESGLIKIDEIEISLSNLLPSLRWMSETNSEDRIFIFRSALLRNVASLANIEELMSVILETAKSIYILHIEQVSSSYVDLHTNLIGNMQDFSTKSADYFLSLNSELRDAIVGALAIITIGLFTWVTSIDNNLVLPVVYFAIPFVVGFNFLVAFYRVRVISTTYSAYHKQHQKFRGFYESYLKGTQTYDVVDDLSKSTFDARTTRLYWYFIGFTIGILIFWVWFCFNVQNLLTS